MPALENPNAFKNVVKRKDLFLSIAIFTVSTLLEVTLWEISIHEPSCGIISTLLNKSFACLFLTPTPK